MSSCETEDPSKFNIEDLPIHSQKKGSVVVPNLRYGDGLGDTLM